MVWTKLFGIGDLDQEKFARLVAKMGRERGHFDNPAVDDEKFCIEDGEAKLFLTNIHRRFLEVPRRDRLAYLERVVLNRPPEAPSWDEVRPLLRPTVRHAGFLRIAELQVQGKEWSGDLVSRQPLAGSLFATMVIDHEHQMSLVGTRHLDRWKAAFPDALAIAVSNLRRVSEEAFVALGPGLWIAPWGDSYAAARLLCPELLQRVCTDPWVCAPDRDTLLVADPTLPDALDVLVDAITRAGPDRSYPLTNQIFALEDKRLRPLEVAPDHPVFSRYRELLVIEAGEMYAAERDAQSGDGPYYAKYTAMKAPTGEIRTYSCWTEGVETLLPPTDIVHVARLDEDGEEVAQSWNIPWDAIVGEPGLVECNDEALPRWRTRRFPDDAWLDTHARVLD